MINRRTLAGAVWALGLTQVVGYGTLYYSFGILAPDMAADFGISREWAFGALAVALFSASLLAPVAGRLADRYGAGRTMSVGSALAALALVLCALAPDRVSFAVALLASEVAACFVLYSSAFVAVVQTGTQTPQRSITHLTLIGGFASTLFWPLTSALHQFLSWREVYFVFAAIHLVICLPAHLWVARISLPHRRAGIAQNTAGAAAPAVGLAPRWHRVAFLLMLAGFALEGFVLSAMLVHMVPLTAALGLGAAGVVVSTLFGPSQVASRFINMLFGERLSQSHLAIIAAALLTLGLACLVLTTPWVAGAIAFAILFGLGSGLMSIVGGTLPFELFGREGYGSRVGWASAARQFTSAFAPFALALTMAGASVVTALWLVMLVAAAGVAAFAGVAWAKRQNDRHRVTSG